MPPYTLATAFEDVTVAALESQEPLDYDQRVRAARLLRTFVCAACAAGLPEDLDEWPPPTHPATWIVAAMRHAGEPQPEHGDIDPADDESNDLPGADRLAEYDAALQISPTTDEFDPLIRRA
jgi:hypothetical protein